MGDAGARVLVIGLDAAEASLLRAWAREGYLPTMRRLLETGHATDLVSPANHFPDVVWPILYTSRGPGRISPYFFILPDPAAGTLQLVHHELSGAEPFWRTASRCGKSCAVIDAPKIGPQPPIGGIQLVNWGGHANTAKPTSHPIGLAAEVRTRYGRYPVRTCDDHGPGNAEYARVRRDLLSAVAVRKRLLIDLLRSRSWDLFFGVFSETHCAGHQFWHLHDPSHPRHPLGAGDLQWALRDIYQAVDAALGEIIEAAGPQARIVVCSAHGMEPEYHARELLPTLLQWWGMQDATDRIPDHAHEPVLRLQQPVLQRLRAVVPLRWQYAVKHRLPKRIESELVCRFMGALKLDVHARAFCVPNNDLNPAIRINVIGRDRFGNVAPGAEYDRLCGFLLTRMRELVNPATGRAALVHVDTIHDAYDGEYVVTLPDVVGFWNTERPLDALYSPGYGTIVGPHQDHRTGGHSETGFLAISGADAALRSGSSDVRDVAPTVLRMLGVPVPAGMEGVSCVV